MNRMGKQFNIGIGAFVKLFLLLTAGAMLIGISGCATKPATVAPQPPIPKAEGLALAGKFRAVAIADLDNDGNLDVVGGASSPGMVTINYGDGRGYQ